MENDRATDIHDANYVGIQLPLDLGAAGSAVAGATVNGTWSGALSSSVSGVTGSAGALTLGTGQMSGGTSVTFTVTGVSGSGLSYDQTANADPDPDSNGTAITIPRP